MPFDLHKLHKFCTAELKQFADSHQNESFYAFAIDAELLCLNSEERFEQTLRDYQKTWEGKTRHIDRWEDLTKFDLMDSKWILDMAARLDGLDLTDKRACLEVVNNARKLIKANGNRYQSEEGIISLRENTGDWAYQGFTRMTPEVGFDDAAYQIHYDLSDEEQKTSEYGIAMDSLVKFLVAADAFSCLKRTPNFYATRVEHTY